MTNRNFIRAAALSFALGCLTPAPSFAQQAAPAQQAGAAASAADACQPSPKGAAPQGKHWYYHTDRSAGRKCWYLGDTGLKTTTSSAEKPKAAPAAADAQQDIDNARAEDSPEPAAAKPLAIKPSTAKPSLRNRSAVTTDSASETTTATPQDTPTPITTTTTASPHLLTERWPDADAFRPSNETTDQSTPLANSQPAPPAQVITPAAATPAPAAKPSEQTADLTPWRVIFGVAFIVLALIAILALITFRYFWRTGDMARDVPGRRRNIWGDDEDETSKPAPSYADMIAPARKNRVAPAPQDLDEIEQLLRRAALEPAPANSNSLIDPATRARTQITPSDVRASAVRHAGSFRPR